MYVPLSGFLLLLKISKGYWDKLVFYLIVYSVTFIFHFKNIFDPQK